MEIFYNYIEVHNTVLSSINASIHAHSSKYLDLLSVFQSLLSRKRIESENLTLRLMRGLEKLNLVSDTVAETQQHLAHTAPMLERATQETESLLAELTQRRAEAERTRASVKEEEERATQAAAEAKELADSAEAQLSEALPALQSAIKAVGKLSRKDITTMGEDWESE
jgi:dynein heavy chain